MKWRFKLSYCILTLLLFSIEIFIALYVHDNFIRPVVGDVLVVILIYCFTSTFIHASVWKTAIAVLLFSYTIEILQYFNFVKILGLQRSALARTVIGTTFAWHDLLAYTTGIILVVCAEKILNKKSAGKL